MPTAWSWKAGRGRRSKGGPAGSAAQTPRRGCRGSPSAFAAREADCAASGRGPAAAGDVFFSNEKNTPQPPLKRPKEGLRPFLWKPFRSLREFFERRARALRCARLRGTLGRGTRAGSFGACGHSEHSALRKTKLTMARQISNRHWCCHSEEQSDVGIRIPSSFRKGRCL